MVVWNAPVRGESSVPAVMGILGLGLKSFLIDKTKFGAISITPSPKMAWKLLPAPAMKGGLKPATPSCPCVDKNTENMMMTTVAGKTTKFDRIFMIQPPKADFPGKASARRIIGPNIRLMIIWI